MTDLHRDEAPGVASQRWPLADRGPQAKGTHVPAVGTLIKEMQAAQSRLHSRQEMKSELVLAFLALKPGDEPALRAYLVEQIMELACTIIREQECATDPGDVPRIAPLHIDAPAGQDRVHYTPALDRRAGREAKRAALPIQELARIHQRQAEEIARISLPAWAS